MLVQRARGVQCMPAEDARECECVDSVVIQQAREGGDCGGAEPSGDICSGTGFQCSC